MYASNPLQGGQEPATAANWLPRGFPPKLPRRLHPSQGRHSNCATDCKATNTGDPYNRSACKKMHKGTPNCERIFLCSLAQQVPAGCPRDNGWMPVSKRHFSSPGHWGPICPISLCFSLACSSLLLPGMSLSTVAPPAACCPCIWWIRSSLGLCSFHATELQHVV